MADLSNARVLILATDGFEESELFEPRQALIDAGAQVTLASIKTDPIRGETDGEKGERTIAPDLTLKQVDSDDYDALILPGGLKNPDTMRMQDEAVEIVADFMEDDKVVAAICHGPWLLVEADMVDGRQVTGYPSIRTDLENAGADVEDAAVVIDGNLITSRNPGDLPAFNEAIIRVLSEELVEQD